MKRLLLLGFPVLAVTLPFFNFLHYQPAGDWLTHASALLMLGLFLLAGSFQQGGAKTVPALFPILLLFAAIVVLEQGTTFPAQGLLFFALGWYGLRLFDAWREERDQFVDALARGIWLAALLQAVIGVVQLAGWAPRMGGWVVFRSDFPTMVMGNLAQRNLYAEVLCWGMVANGYLHARGLLNRWLAGVACLALVFLASWSGARLPLAYCLAFCVLGWFWLRRNPSDLALQRMLGVLAATAILFALVQAWSPELESLLRQFGWGVSAESGAQRLLDNGYARRQLEWSKAWEVFRQHPWLGIGLGNYPWASAWLETFGGWPKVLNTGLFTHSHNLLLQLLAETGLAGTALVLLALFCGLAPYFRRGQQTPQNLLLMAIAAMLLGHSMLEYPLWYLPFLLMLVTILALSPVMGWRIPFRDGLRRGGALVVGLASVLYVVSGGFAYYQVVHAFVPSTDPAANISRERELLAIARNPFWSDEAELGLVNYMQLNRAQLPVQRELLERVARKQPFVEPLVKLSVARALSGDEKGAREALSIAIVNFSDLLPYIVSSLHRYQEPEVLPLRGVADRAMNAAMAAGGDVPSGHFAAIATVQPKSSRKMILQQ
ncbi:hypothetical protein CEK28_00440 [Xenophilus sp. AP218F]|nr:hypothetical protein CEK28_00440 [Xenophilus sp. AP218F]